MNENDILALLDLKVGEMRFVRERHLPHGVMHRYDDGWWFLPEVSDRLFCPRAVIGYRFPTELLVTYFITGYMGKECAQFSIVGARQ